MHPEIPCEVCGSPRTFHVGLQWCSNCGWNREAALSSLRLRSRVMIVVAACILLGEAFLLWAIPKMGVIYLPLGLFLAAAVAFIPYREYRHLQRSSLLARVSSSPELVASKLGRLKPQLRTSAVLLLVFACATDLVLFLMPVPWASRILPAIIVLAPIVFFGSQFLIERRIAASYATTVARIVRFERRGKGGRIAIYEYKPLNGGLTTGKRGSLIAFSVGMTVPILYNVSKPDESLPVPDFIFYRIRADDP